MRLVYFTHSLTSCWNHGNAHFLRGVLRELQNLGHTIKAYEPENGWSRANLIRDHGQAGLDAFTTAYPDLESTLYGPFFDIAEAVDGADVVIAHEWNDPALIATLSKLRTQGAPFLLLFHDTHHRAISDPDAMWGFDLDGFDGILAFGETLADVYRRWGWGDRVFVWHEAADTALFHPPSEEGTRNGLVFIGNWGDGERTEELETFLFRPSAREKIPLDVYGVRYPEPALDMLARYGAHYHGWLANPRAPEIFAQHKATVHVPRRFYAEALPGIPTIRVFEALACGIPLLSAPWDDAEHLFRPGQDYLIARDGNEMATHMRAVANDDAISASLKASGLEIIQSRHSCAHRARELTGIVDTLRAASAVVEVTT